ncbi:monovalent cation/H+ antiporter subunit E [Corynebacterium aquatimens]|uniref:Multicomponent Na+:H+ antiporter subunit E n=1 Tax=Corynebacterium aquatimens TaxID=1190508 RepID=A0A931GWG6_9CORY|nr:monovalent cation/H+ antiporter subunit E [Corynebacterium aquatimens]MBG6122551.1 multicomponent Na+:H+ antiporter subunit E [Corynebacterium aquatimens]WJY64909.1 putative monovalent cation/H+ antiporter subunit E [Corynebacterium aquatimens]
MKILHGIGYFFWIVKEIYAAGTSAAIAAFKKDPGLRPIIIFYPLRLTTEWELFWFSTSITATPGTMSIGFREPEDSTDPTLLLVEAAFGDDPADIIASLADMEEHVNPKVKGIAFDVDSVKWEPYVRLDVDPGKDA